MNVSESRMSHRPGTYSLSAGLSLTAPRRDFSTKPSEELNMCFFDMSETEERPSLGSSDDPGIRRAELN